MSSATVSPRGFGIRHLKFAAGLVVGLVMLLPVVIAVHAGIYNSFVDNPLSGWGMWGNFAIYAATRPSWKEYAVTISVGLALRLAYDLAIGEHGYPGSAIIGMGVFLGLACLAVLAVRSLEPPSERRAIRQRSLAVIGLFSYIGVFLAFYVSYAKLALPSKLDYFLYNFDGSLGFQASFAAGNLTRAIPALQWTEAMVYNSIGFWFSLIYAAHVAYRTRYRISIIKLLVTNAVIGFSLYFLFPAMGPVYAFHSFPQVPGPIVPAPVLLRGVPNAMPSLHFAGTLLIWWLARPWKWLYRITGVYSALTALATLGLGEHYLVDLVVAFPYALAIFALAATTARAIPLAAGSAMVLLWLLFLRMGHYYTAASWVMLVVTIATSYALQDRMAARVWVPE